MNDTTLPRPMGLSARLRIVGRACVDIDRPYFYFLLAALMTFGVEWLSRQSPVSVLLFMWNSPLAYLCNYGIILLTLLPSLLFRRRVAGIALMSAVWTLLGITQCIVLLSRVSPLSAVDIAISFSVITIIGAYLTPWQIVLIAVGLVGVVVGLVLLFIRVKRHPIQLKRFLIIYGATILTTALIIVGGYASGQLSDYFPNLATAYDDYGFPYCFSMSVVDKGVDRPSDYGEELMTGILDDLDDKDDSETPPVETPLPAEKRDPNVIIVQLESFFDVKYMQGVTYSEDPIPTFTALKEQYASGLLNVPVIGAGTVNSEFEVLAGMNCADFGAGEYPFRSIIMEESCETIAYDLLASGYRTHAIHNHEGSFYLRHEVYRNLGFETFTSIEYFENPTFNENDWAHDALLTDEILYLLQSTEESDFVFAVSVQGHGKYPDKYTPAPDDILITAGIEDTAVKSHFEYYINQINEMDAFIDALYRAVMAMDEDTVLVLYGDHMPGIVRDEGITLATSEFQTEYIIISNYETPVSPTDGTLYTYQIFPTVMEIIDNDEGIMNRFHRTYRDDPKYLTLLSALEYDALYGDRLVYGGKAFPEMDLVMGSRPIAVTDCYAEGGYLYIKGTNFTTYSHVCLDGRKQNTEFIDASTLRVKDDKASDRLKEIPDITVKQISQTDEVLSETAAYRPGGA